MFTRSLSSSKGPMMLIFFLLSALLILTTTATTVTWSVSSDFDADDPTIIFAHVKVTPPAPNIGAQFGFQSLPYRPSASIMHLCRSTEADDGRSLTSVVVFHYAFQANQEFLICKFQFSTLSGRFPIKFTLTTNDSKIGSLYNFPGISPITGKIEPMIQIRSVSPGTLSSPTFSRIIGHSIDFPQSLLSKVYFFYAPVNTKLQTPSRYADPNDHLIDTNTMSLHAWTSDLDFLMDFEKFPETTSIYPSFTLENHVNKVPWSTSDFNKDDITTITPIELISEDTYTLTITYDLQGTNRPNNGLIYKNIAGSFSDSMIKISFPKTTIFSYFDLSFPTTCHYFSDSLTVPGDISEIASFMETKTFNGQSSSPPRYLTKIQCSLRITSTSLTLLRDDQELFGPNITSDYNQFSTLIELQPFDSINFKPSLLVLGNKYTQQDFKNLLNGIPISDTADQIPPPIYQIYPPIEPSPNITSQFTLKQVSLEGVKIPSDSQLYIKYSSTHILGDGTNPLGNRQIIYTAHQLDRWGPFCEALLDPTESSATTRINTDTPNILTISIGPVTPPNPIVPTKITIKCTLYRHLSTALGTTFLIPSLARATLYQPKIEIITVGSPSQTQTDSIDVPYPKFIPTPTPLIRHTNIISEDEISMVNTGLPVLNWDNVTIKLFSLFSINSDHLPFSTSGASYEEYLYQNLIDPITFVEKFKFEIIDMGQCGTYSTLLPSPPPITSLNIDLELEPSTLPIVNDGIRKCTIEFKISFENYQNDGITFIQSFPIWKSQTITDISKPFFGLTVNNLPSIYPFPLSLHPSTPNPNPSTLSIITPLSSLKLHICFPYIIPIPSLFTIEFFGYKTLISTTPIIPPESQFFFGPKYSPNIRDSLFNSCIAGFTFKITYGTKSLFDNSIGQFVHFGLKFLVDQSTSPSVSPPIYSPKFRIQSPMPDILNTVDIITDKSLIQYQPSNSSPLVRIINPIQNKINIFFNFGLEITNLSLPYLHFSLQLPSWIIIDISESSIYRCTTSNQPPDHQSSSLSIISRKKSILNPDFTSTIFSVDLNSSIQGPATTICTFGIHYDETISQIPINPSIPIPITPITVNLPDFSSTLTQSNNNIVFFHPTAPKLFCPIDTNMYNPCLYQDQPILTPPLSTTVPPPIITKLPVTTRGLSNLCEIILTNRDTFEIYNDSKHENTCSIPIAGMVTSRIITLTELNNVLTPDSIALLSSGQQDFTLCDCKCKGYWNDDILNLDEKKCSKCIVPKCPELFTPNNECTTCECITEQCKRFHNSIFTTMYLKPQILRHFIESEGKTEQILYNSIQLTEIELNEYLLSPSESKKALYFSIMSFFSQSLLNHIKTRDIDDLSNTSTLESITITPLVEGSFTVWKLTFSIINNSQKLISSLSPLYGLPTLQSSIGELFSSFYNNEYLNFDPITVPPQTNLGLDITTPVLSDGSVSSNLKFFISDVINTGCLSREDALKLESTNAPATIDMLHPCPLPNQYTPIHNDLEKADLLNPLWSTCSTTSSSPSSFSPEMEFIQYESLLQSTVLTTSRSIRQIFPRCLDFAGVDVGLLNVPCKIDPESIVYSTTSSTLLLPTYTQALLSSFSTDTLDLSIKQRISKLRDTILPKFPSFPQLTIVPCPTIDISSSNNKKPIKQKKDDITESYRCPVGTYGDKCEFKNTIEKNSMFMSPTNLSIQSHSHIQWEYLGDNTQELTLVLQSNTKTNTGSGYFVWSQLLGTVPIASLYASAQIPTIDQSKLFQYVYDSISHGNTDMTDIYNQSTQVIIRGYFTRAANITIALDPGQIIQNFFFELPMVCTDFDVRCRYSTSQFCHQSDGRCRCKNGYYNSKPDQQRNPYYIIENTFENGSMIFLNFDGDDLSCLPICQNNGNWNDETQLCICKPGFNGVNCDQCKQLQADLCTSGSNPITTTDTTTSPQIPNGYVPLVEGQCQDSCACYGKWTESITPSDNLTQKSCSTCSLKPISRELYDNNSLEVIKTVYLNSAELSPHYNSDRDEKYTQIYQPTVDNIDTTTIPAIHQDLTRQRCYITGTQNKTWEFGECNQCLCHRGYGGDYCQLHIAYANITYTPGVNNKYTYDTMTEALLFDKITEELSLSMTNFNKNDLFIVKHDTKNYWIEIGFYTGLDFFIRNAKLMAVNSNVHQEFEQGRNVHQEFEQEQSVSSVVSEYLSSLSILSSYFVPLSFQFQPLAENINVWNQPPTNFNSQLPSNLDNLYTQWGQLQGNLPTTPLVHQDSGSFLGDIDIKEPIQDPVCFDQGLLGCSGEPPKRASSTALIIGLVVGLVCAALLLLVLILVLRWCKKNKRGFWKSKADQDRDEMSNFVPTPRKEFTGSIAAPTMTVGTLSIMPAGINDGVEMTKTGASATSPASSVQSVNNHIEIKDSTLPAEYKAYKDAKGNVFYINSETMTTSWTHPNEVNTDITAGGGGAGYGDDW